MSVLHFFKELDLIEKSRISHTICQSQKPSIFFSLKDRKLWHFLLLLTFEKTTKSIKQLVKETNGRNFDGFDKRFLGVGGIERAFLGVTIFHIIGTKLCMLFFKRPKTIFVLRKSKLCHKGYRLKIADFYVAWKCF